MPPKAWARNSSAMADDAPPNALIPDRSDKAADEVSNPGYHYWHDTVPKGEGAAPTPVPKALETVVPTTKLLSNIDSFSFLEEDDLIKLYIALDGDLAEVTDAEVQATFERPQFSDDFRMEVRARLRPRLQSYGTPHVNVSLGVRGR